MRKAKIKKGWVPLFLLLGLLILDLTPLAHAGVGLEYLGPNPLRPQPISGEPNSLGAGAIVGNTGSDPATITFTLLADQEFNSQFTYSISDNNFSLSPNTRTNFALVFTFDPSTIAVKNYSAVIKIVASPTTTSGTSGSASFDLPVAISANVLSSSYSGYEVTLDTASGVYTVTTPSTATTASMTTQPPQTQTNAVSTNSPSTNSLAASSFFLDPNLLVGIAVGAIAILVGFFAFNRKKGATKSPAVEPVKATTERTCIRCGTALRMEDRFCDGCGARQDG